MAQAKGQAKGGDIAIILSADEAEAVERAIRECTARTGSADVGLLEAVEDKIKEAKGKML